MQVGLHETKLPGFVPASTFRRAVAAAIRPPRRISVSEAMARWRRVNNPGSYVGPWLNEKTPFGVEPMDRTVSRSVSELWFVGPSQVIKTEILLGNVAHAIKVAARDILIVHPTRDLALDFSKRRIGLKFLDPSPDLRCEVRGGRSDDKALDKIFRNGTMLTVAWPVAGQLASRPVPTVALDERDRMPDNIGGEGDPGELARNRTRTFGRNGMVIGSSSPSRDDGTGIMAEFARGDQKLWAWPCPECGEFWTPGFDADRRPVPFDHLKWSPSATTQDAVEKSAFLACPRCGAVLDDAQKEGMNAAGVWVALGQSVTRAGKIEGAPPSGRVASYWLTGLASPWVTWGQLAGLYFSALDHFERTGEETKLRTVYNTGFGIPYESRARGRAPVKADDLAARCDDYALGTVPGSPDIHFLAATVDVQGDRFEVEVKAWGADDESWLVDRFAIRQLDDGRTDIDPGRCPEHWRVLVPRVLARGYPVADGSGLVFPVASVGIDTGGIEGVTANAKAFQRLALAAGVEPWRITLLKGANTRAAPAFPNSPTVEKDDAGRPVPGSALFVIGVHTIKDTLNNRLRRRGGGPASLHFPKDTPARYFEEVTAERRDAKGFWEKTGANESWDLEVYQVATLTRLRPERVNWTAPTRPWWGRPDAPAAVAARTPSTDGLAVLPRRVARAGRRVRSKGI